MYSRDAEVKSMVELLRIVGKQKKPTHSPVEAAEAEIEIPAMLLSNSVAITSSSSCTSSSSSASSSTSKKSQKQEHNAIKHLYNTRNKSYCKK